MIYHRVSNRLQEPRKPQEETSRTSYLPGATYLNIINVVPTVQYMTGIHCQKNKRPNLTAHNWQK